MKILLYLRSGLFTLTLWLSVLLIAPIILLLLPLPVAYRDYIGNNWNRQALAQLALFCNLHARYEGLEHIPAHACIVFSKHQSAWETIALQPLFQRTSWIMKRELLWIPFFGWALWALKPIAIDRSAGKSALRKLLTQGEQRLAENRWVIIFPEGTRAPVGQTLRYRIGGAKLAETTGIPVLPVAHNAGVFWPKNSFIKYPGTITLRFGPLIPTKGKTAEEINAEAQTWIEANTQELVERAHVSRR
jgi:1-acyl-sn-glycerol-3-phosphate acyltransferase